MGTRNTYFQSFDWLFPIQRFIYKKISKFINKIFYNLHKYIGADDKELYRKINNC
jgi:hypothetical protein